MSIGEGEQYIDFGRLVKDLGITIGVLGWTHHQYKNQLAEEKIKNLREFDKFYLT